MPFAAPTPSDIRTVNTMTVAWKHAFKQRNERLDSYNVPAWYHIAKVGAAAAVG